MRDLAVPAAHAPAGEDPADPDLSASPRACAEELSHTYLACVLANLRCCPSFATDRKTESEVPSLWVENVDALVAPAGAFGGPGALSLLARGSKVLAIPVSENEVQITPVTAQQLGASFTYSAQSYLEAAGILAAHRQGIYLPSLRPGADHIPLVK